MNDVYTKRLRCFRKSRNSRTTQLEFSEELDITPEHYSKIENGDKNPSVPLHIDFCLKLKKPSDCFFKSDRTDISLSSEQIEHLLSLDTIKLRKILAALQSLYEKQK